MRLPESSAFLPSDGEWLAVCSHPLVSKCWEFTPPPKSQPLKIDPPPSAGSHHAAGVGVQNHTETPPMQDTHVFVGYAVVVDGVRMQTEKCITVRKSIPATIWKRQVSTGECAASPTV